MIPAPEWDEFETTRRRMYAEDAAALRASLDDLNARAHALLAALDEYEEAHPKDAPCLLPDLEALKRQVQP